MRTIVVILLSINLILNVFSQETEYPIIGAQVFIEPGQSDEDIEAWFKLLNKSNMPICRIRMFENHINKGGTWDFSLYDKAFDYAAKYNIKIFGTLFPTVDANNIGGFKYPDDKAHLDRVKVYIDKVVNHFKDHKAMYTWVLINEPGVMPIPMEKELTKEKYQEWLDTVKFSDYDPGYRKDEFKEEYFIRDYQTWYLKVLANEVRKYDKKTYLHVNPHAIYNILHRYDMSDWEPILTSFGASMHPSWHFRFIDRKDFALAVSGNNDIIRHGAMSNPYWVTELQGGNNIFSGLKPICPTKEETAQWVWTSIMAGAEGVIFWTLNPRGTGGEAGEWALVNFQNKPSDRLEVSAEIANTIAKNKDVFSNFNVHKSNVSILYTPESFWQQNSLLIKINNMLPGRDSYAIVQSILAYYKALNGMGMQSEIIEMDDFNWDNAKGQTIIIPNQISIPSWHWDNMKKFVANGGKLIMSGLSGYFDEFRHNVMNINPPLTDVLGAELEEIKLIGEKTSVNVDGIELPAHLWNGFIAKEGSPQYLFNTYGKGQSLWIPSTVGLGAWLFDDAPLAAFLKKNIDYKGVTFDKHYKHVVMRVAESNSKKLISLVNTNDEAIVIGLNGFKLSHKTKVLFRLFDSSVINNGKVMLQANECMVLLEE